MQWISRASFALHARNQSNRFDMTGILVDGPDGVCPARTTRRFVQRSVHRAGSVSHSYCHAAGPAGRGDTTHTSTAGSKKKTHINRPRENGGHRRKKKGEPGEIRPTVSRSRPTNEPACVCLRPIRKGWSVGPVGQEIDVVVGFPFDWSLYPCYRRTYSHVRRNRPTDGTNSHAY